MKKFVLFIMVTLVLTLTLTALSWGGGANLSNWSVFLDGPPAPAAPPPPGS